MSIKHTFAVAALVTSSLLAACGADDAAKNLEGRWDGPGRAAISLNADGTGEGNDGCNDVAVEWKSITETTGIFAVTESGDMGCRGVAGWGEATAYVISAID